jgi:crossover junction endodeoxyribonuclease RuvC
MIDIRGHTYHCLDYGIIRAVHLKALDEKLLHIFQAIQALLHKHQPEAVAIEGIYGKPQKPHGTLLLGQARGVALLAVALERTPVFEYSPSRIKKAVGAGGNNSKAAVTRMVRMLLQLPEQRMRADAYDGLAAALCHAHTVLGSVRSKLSMSTVPAMSKASAMSKGSTSSFADRLKKSYVAPKGAQ